MFNHANLWRASAGGRGFVYGDTMRPRSEIQAPGLCNIVVSVAELRAAGVTKWWLYNGDLNRTLWGHAVRPGSDPTAFSTKVASLRLLMRPGRFISRATAARLYAIPVWRESDALVCGAVRPTKPPEHKGLAGHRIGQNVLYKEPEAPLWLPHPAEVWGLLSAQCSLQDLVIAGDFLLSGRSRREAPLCTREELRLTLERFKGSVGIEKLRQAMPLLATGVESPAESRTRLQIVQAGLPVPQTCCPVQTKERTLFADLGYPEWKIAIEYDGAYHFENGIEQARRDNERIESMLDSGWRVIRVTALDLRDPSRFIARLARALQDAGAPIRN